MPFFPWLVSVTMVFSISATARILNGRPSCQLQEFVGAAVAIAGLLALMNVISKLFKKEELQAELGFDGVVALCVGCTLEAFFALLEVAKLF
jgi:hypothetical protein